MRIRVRDLVVMDAILFIRRGYSLEQTWQNCLFDDDRKRFESFKDFCERVNERIGIMEN